uniref:THO complex subunit 7 homolog n=1 Tax=Caenorhabditis tropicalis TaxID=1561998 RepID=A0A1I7UH42_9PELO
MATLQEQLAQMKTLCKTLTGSKKDSAERMIVWMEAYANKNSFILEKNNELTHKLAEKEDVIEEAMRIIAEKDWEIQQKNEEIEMLKMLLEDKEEEEEKEKLINRKGIADIISRTKELKAKRLEFAEMDEQIRQLKKLGEAEVEDSENQDSEDSETSFDLLEDTLFVFLNLNFLSFSMIIIEPMF